MKFDFEVGGIIDKSGNLLHYTEGSPGMVVFPQDILHELHKNSPGIVFNLAHTHPPRLSEMSNEDLSTLKAQALAMYPFPARMSVITEMADGLFQENRYIGFWQSRDEWARDKTKPRKFTWFKERQLNFDMDTIMSSDENSYCLTLVKASYHI